MPLKFSTSISRALQQLMLENTVNKRRDLGASMYNLRSSTGLDRTVLAGSKTGRPWPRSRLQPESRPCSFIHGRRKVLKGDGVKDLCLFTFMMQIYSQYFSGVYSYTHIRELALLHRRIIQPQGKKLPQKQDVAHHITKYFILRKVKKKCSYNIANFFRVQCFVSKATCWLFSAVSVTRFR